MTRVIKEYNGIKIGDIIILKGVVHRLNGGGYWKVTELRVVQTMDNLHIYFVASLVSTNKLDNYMLPITIKSVAVNWLEKAIPLSLEEALDKLFNIIQ